MLCLGISAHAQWDKDAFFYRGRLALRDGKFATAIENFNILAQLDTTNYWNYFFRGIAKYNLGDLRGAYNDFNTSVRINPVFTNGYHYRAITQSRAGNYDSAFQDYAMAMSLRPGSVGLYYSRGVAFFLSQQFSKAVEDFNRYIRKEPKDPSAYLNRGASQLFLGDTTAALADYNKAIKLDRFDPEGYIRRGRLYASSGKLDEGIADLDKAVELDSLNTFAIFNRALMLYEKQDFIRAVKDLNKVLAIEPGNALTIYNRALIETQVGEYRAALADFDKVAAINPDNVLVYFNRAALFIQMKRYQDALEDYDMAIALYPDFAKAYMNRSYVKSMLGRTKSSKEDYRIAQKKVEEYKARNSGDNGSFADTTRQYSSLLAFDADFAKKDFNDELLQHRDVDVRLRPSYQFVLSDSTVTAAALSHRYDNPLMDRFIGTSALPIRLSSEGLSLRKSSTKVVTASDARGVFLQALADYRSKFFNSALTNYDKAIEMTGNSKKTEDMYKSFYLMNRAVLRAEMIDFIASIDNNVQVLSMDESGNTRARVKDRVNKDYDYTQALDDLKAAASINPDNAYIKFDLGNILCLSEQYIQAINAYSDAIEMFPQLGDAYYNRALIQIYLKDKDKGCSDLSVAGELGIGEAYTIIKKYCEERQR